MGRLRWRSSVYCCSLSHRVSLDVLTYSSMCCSSRPISLSKNAAPATYRRLVIIMMSRPSVTTVLVGSEWLIF